MPTRFESVNDDVISLALNVLSSQPRFKPIFDNGVRIEYLFAYSDGDGPALKHHGAAALAVIKIVSPEERATDGPDLRLKIDAKRFEKRGLRAREAILAHEFYHVEIVKKDGIVQRDVYDRPRIKLIPDDWSMTGFIEVAEWYGSDSAERRSFEALREILNQSSFSFMELQDGAKERPVDYHAAVLGLGEVPNSPIGPVPVVEPVRDEPPPLENPGAELRGAIVGKLMEETLSAEPPPALPLKVGDVVKTSYNDTMTWTVVAIKPCGTPGMWEVTGKLVGASRKPSTAFFSVTMEGSRTRVEGGGYLLFADPEQAIDDEPAAPPPGPFPKLAEMLTTEAVLETPDGGKPRRTKAKPVAEPEDDTAIFAIHSQKGVLRGFVSAPTLRAARAYQKESFPSCSVEIDDLGLVSRSPGYSVPDVDAEGRLLGAISPAKRERPAAKLKPRTKTDARL